MEKYWNTALGYYQNVATAQKVLRKLRQKGFKRSLSIHCSNTDKISIQYYAPVKIVTFFIISLFIFCLFLFFLIPKLDPILEIVLIVLSLFGIWLAYSTYLYRVNAQIINRYKNEVLRNETLIIAQVKDRYVNQVLQILRSVETDHPITFLLRLNPFHAEESDQQFLHEPLTTDELQDRAMKLAHKLKNVHRIRTKGNPLRNQLSKKARILEKIRRNVAEAEYIEQTLTMSGSWLLDNDYNIQENIKEIERGLPLKYYQQLPKIVDGPMARLPRIYAIAGMFIESTANRLNKDNILSFLNAYQSVESLTVGELWALPIMLRLRLIESIQSLAVLFDERLREGELARYWGNRLLTAARRQQQKLPSVLKNLKIQQPNPSPHFIEELLEHLFDEDSVLIPVKEWVNTRYSTSISEIIQKEQKHETVNEVMFSSAVISLISLKQLSWREIFESTSKIDAILRNDPLGVYGSMNFATRDRYRHEVEKLARQSECNESEVATVAVDIAKEGCNEVTRHVGYYLIDEGRKQLEKQINFRTSALQKIGNFFLEYPITVYLGSITILTILLEAGLYDLSMYFGATFNQTLFFLILSLFPISELSIQLVHLFLSYFVPPEVLPKMNFSNGVPEKNKTLVVIPTMLISKESFLSQLHQLEIHYLANSDPALKFGLLLDYGDAPEQTLKEDAQLLESALQAMQDVENKYGTHKFFLFLRERQWNAGEMAWIGWERKRGKLECLNEFLMDDSIASEMLRFGDRTDLKNIRYVINLDGDTQLPKGKAIQLIEAISHPLNVAQVSAEKTIKRGYTIVQPRVSTDIGQYSQTWFARIFSDAIGIDPYTQATSNIYQDLIHEGSYHGKCIYDVQTFHKILSKTFPEEHLLSHDLLEGSYVRVAYASDICLFDQFPQTYQTWSLRQHRWMRGDWQIIDWLFSKVPSLGSEKLINPLVFINKWKIFDNLRRALSYPVSLLLLVTSWFYSTTPGIWTTVVVAYFFMPVLLEIFSNPVKYFYALLTSFKQIGMSFLKAIIMISLMPYQAYISMDALIRVIYRRNISKQLLLEWSQKNHISQAAHKKFIYNLLSVSLFSVAVLAILMHMYPSSIPWAISFCIIWMLAPIIVSVLDNKAIIERNPLRKITSSEQKFLRKVARKTWRYFDDFVGPQSNWLPPDNFQSSLNIEVALRTSTTNIGLWMLAAVSAYDLRYISCDVVIDRVLSTFNTLTKLETYEGHLLNWYDTNTLKPLFPRYVSTVDNGNLLGSLWVLQQAIQKLINEPVFPFSLFQGLKDTFEVFCEETQNSSWQSSLEHLKSLLLVEPDNLFTAITLIKSSLTMVQELLSHNINIDESQYWLKQLENQLLVWNDCSQRYLSWAEVMVELPLNQLEVINKDLSDAIQAILRTSPSLSSLASGKFFANIISLLEIVHATPEIDLSIVAWVNRLKETFYKAQWLAGEKITLADNILKEANRISEMTNMQFLYSPERKLFSIGFHVEDCKLDNSFYDLLASEARIASLVAIAKGDVPLEHWWSLGRPYRIIQGRKILVSWGGTMFEYLMPQLFTRYYEDSLLGNACKNAVYFQMKYGENRGIPWGISEAAFSEIDTHRIYQYRSFGVPVLGFKRDLDKDLVVSPYSTVLALSINPVDAVKNLDVLSRDSHNLYSTHGFYESIDFTRQKGPHGERGIIIYAFMAHHQGMSLLSINNLLNNNIMQDRFHSDLRIQGVESLLYEQIPSNPPLSQSYKRDVLTTRLIPFSVLPIMGMLDTPHTSTPKINLLANGAYSIMLTNSGGGYSKWNDIDITRWRSDTTCDAWGSFCYIRDLGTGKFWSTTYQPTYTKGQRFSVKFKPDKVEYQRRDQQIETTTEIVVSPQDDVEIRLITLANLSHEKRNIELTSYNELALAPHKTDRAHPCFNKFFIETESMLALGGIVAFRRMRSETDQPIWAAHIVTSNQDSNDLPQFETDRSIFIGRGNTLAHPQALKGDLKNSEGYVLDPIFSLRKKIILEPGQRVQVSFITAIAKDRQTIVSLMKKYNDINASHLAMDMAWTHSQLDLRHLKMHQEEAQLYQKLASHILYPHSQLRISQARLCKNKLTQSRLWAYSISGDLPIVTISIADFHEVDLVKQVLTAHAFWRMRGLKVDLVILNEEAAGYEHPLYENLKRIIVSSQMHGTEIGEPGGVFLLNSNQIPEEDILLILSVSQVHLVASRGFLRQHLASPIEPTHFPSRQLIHKGIQEVPSRPLPFLELPYFNGLGGFTPDGKEYVIYLGEDTHTPAPWINVIANPKFGVIVTEAGLGCTWYGNSQTNRLTPWSNDPLLNPISDTIYIRDDESGAFWTPTPSPIREIDAYRTRHGQGYSRFEHNSHGIEQNLEVFVPTDEEGGLPVRIQKLHLVNRSSQKRTLSIYSYSELVLGGDKEETQMHVVTSWDVQSQALLACNNYNSDCCSYIAFVSANMPIHSYTGNRTEFIGRNHNSANPASLRRKALSDQVGAGYDPCAALQITIELHPDEEKGIIFTMGYAQNIDTVRSLTSQCKDDKKVDQMFLNTQKYWDTILSTIHVDCPELFINFALNRWLLYQNLSCRLWGRSAFYQSSGAFGFRDQLQDVMALLYTSPKSAREQILRSAAQQFVEGDVQHWWLPPSNSGVRTRISDDLLWLPYVTAQYVRVTNDSSILDEIIPFITGDLLKDDQQEIFFTPEISKDSGTLLEHCRRAIEKGTTSGPHGLPLIGGGDWNDGMNLVGIQGKGESVWLAWFLIHVLNDFAYLLTVKGQPNGNSYQEQAKRLAKTVENNGWDGDWYLRAYMDDGTPLGSKNNEEDKIDSLSQSWGVISGAADPKRVQVALESAEKFLVRKEDKLVLLLTPPFDKIPLDPGYIKGYPPGVRENGGQYTHGSLWLAMALARQGEGDKAVELLNMMHPVMHSHNMDEVSRYKIEPYVTAGDVYSLVGKVGRGGWSWYSGSAAWMYRIWIEEIFGFRLQGDLLELNPTIPRKWEIIKIEYRHRSSKYVITFENPKQMNRGKVEINLDGTQLPDNKILLIDDGQTHIVRCVLK